MQIKLRNFRTQIKFHSINNIREIDYKNINFVQETFVWLTMKGYL